jgi:hypothetical protein
VRIGFDPNGIPFASPSVSNCADFNTFVGALDFVAPSFYENWTHTEQGESQIETSLQRVIGRLENRGFCQVTAYSRLPFAIGEFGVAGSFFFSNSGTRITRNPSRFEEYRDKRRELYRNLLGWASSQRSGAPLFINIWTLGNFDPVGIDQNASTPDPDISQLFKQYLGSRCGR